MFLLEKHLVGNFWGMILGPWDFFLLRKCSQRVLRGSGDLGYVDTNQGHNLYFRGL